MLALFLMAAHWWACVNFSIHRYSEAHAPQTWATVSGLSSYDPDTGLHDVCYAMMFTLYFMHSTCFSQNLCSVRQFAKPCIRVSIKPLICDIAYFTLYLLVMSSAVVSCYILYETAAVLLLLSSCTSPCNLHVLRSYCIYVHITDMLTHCSLLLPAQPVLHHDNHVNRWVWRCVPGYTERNAVDAGGHYEWCHADWRHSSRFHGGLYGDGRTR
jgi:hypothetical protein